MDDLQSLRVVDLKEALKKRDLPVSGKKADLIERLREALTPEVRQCDLSYHRSRSQAFLLLILGKICREGLFDRLEGFLQAAPPAEDQQDEAKADTKSSPIAETEEVTMPKADTKDDAALSPPLPAKTEDAERAAVTAEAGDKTEQKDSTQPAAAEPLSQVKQSEDGETRKASLDQHQTSLSKQAAGPASAGFIDIDRANAHSGKSEISKPELPASTSQEGKLLACISILRTQQCTSAFALCFIHDSATAYFAGLQHP